MKKERKAIIAREKEINELETIFHSDNAEFLVIYGRRRVGKTFLISNFFREKGLYFELTGIKGASLSTQLKNFAIVYSDVFSKSQPVIPPKTWLDAFTLLRRQIEKLSADRKIILFFDELPWLASSRSGFLQAFEHFWNRYLSRDNRVILVVCGSAAAWMIRNILDARGGLHGRITRIIRLLPFNLMETERFLRSRKVNLDRKQIIEIYMAMGGVAQYLSQVKQGLSSSQVIQEVCFSESGYLTREFYRLYSSLFSNFEHHVAVIKILSNHSGGLSRDDLLSELKIKSGGTASRVLHELEESGFIMSIPSLGKRKVKWIYRLIDPFSLFYLKWIEKKNLKMGYVENHYWTKQQTSQSWAAWAGYAFENICYLHINQIKAALGLAGISSSQAAWSFRPKKGKSDQKGVQIDLVIERADNCINLCEMKFHKTEFVLTKNYAKEIEVRKRIFEEQTQTKKTLFNTLITAYGAKRNEHYLGVIDQQLDMHSLFRD